MKTSKTNPIKTVLTLSVGFGIIFIFSDIKWFLYTSPIIGVLGLSSNKIAEGIDFLWMKLAKILSFIVPNILLSIIFYTLLFPISCLSRIFANKDALQLKNKGETLWVSTGSQIEKDTFEKMW